MFIGELVTNPFEIKPFADFREDFYKRQKVVNQFKIERLKLESDDLNAKLKLKIEEFKNGNKKSNPDNTKLIQNIHHLSNLIISLRCRINELKNFGNIDAEELVS
jgi:hypothetical protein